MNGWGIVGRWVIILLVLLPGCAADPGKVFVKDGQQYGVTTSKIWRDRWWNFYERGRSYAVGEFWNEAIADFKTAIGQRDDDQRRARTYGLHFIDYFPHRELGIVYYRLKRPTDAIRALETSLRSADTAKAKFYLNKARKAELERSQRDQIPPRILLDSPRDGLLTNRYSVTVQGRAHDDTFVASLNINGQAQFIELAAPDIPFSQDIALQDGKNIVEVTVTDLLGQQARKHITVVLDRHGPLVGFGRIDLRGTPPQQHVQVVGFVSDNSPIVHFNIAGQSVSLLPGTGWTFRQDLALRPGAERLPFEIEDAAGNWTHGEILLKSAADAPVREGQPLLHRLPRWASLAPGTVIADLPYYRTAATQAPPDPHPPVINLRGVSDREMVYADTFYLEGRVTDASAITAFSINGESLWRQPTRQLFFGLNIALQPGENVVSLEAIDAAGHIGRHTLVMTREIRTVKQVGSRLRMSFLPFTHNGAASVLSDTVYESLFNTMVQQGRFGVVERQKLDSILAELRLSQTQLADPAAAVKTGKLLAAEGMLIGTVTETPQAMEVFARFVDVETSAVLAAVDVYGEDLTLLGLQTLVAGMAWKLQRYFPLVEGVVVDKTGQALLTDLSETQRIKQYMKLIVYRDGEQFKHPRTGRLLKKPDVILGEARITSVSADLSEATILWSKPAGTMQEFDKVMTK